MNVYELFYKALNLFLPDHCISSLVQERWMSMGCLKVFVTKALGYGVILGSVLVKVPQILKMLRARSSEGMSITGVVLELIACMATLCYSVSRGFPFSAYGETCFMTLQQSIILLLVLIYTTSPFTTLIGYSFFVISLSYLLSPLAPPSLLFILQTSVIFLLIASRLMQAHTNYKNSSTGQLSFITVQMQTLGSAARIFTSFSEVGDVTTILMFVVSFVTNSILLSQILLYWTNENNNNKTNDLDNENKQSTVKASGKRLKKVD